MRITSDGNVGIGTSTPAQILDIRATNLNLAYGQNLNQRMQIGGNQGSAGNFTGIYGGYIEGGVNFGTSTYLALGINYNGTYSEKLRILDDNVGIGNQSPNQRLVIGSTAAFFTASGSGDQFVVHANASSNASGYFYYNSINNYGTISDRRIKSDITPITTQDALAFISNITPSDFVLNGQTERQSGFIAQNVLAAVQNDAQKSAIAKWETYDDTDPECPFMGISDRPILSNLVAVVKSQQTEIDGLQSKVDALESFIQSKFPGEFSL
jgi:hypothetical protein